MDQGLAAVWAGAAGLVGAGIGGAAAVWGAAIGGRRTVEAAERQAQRTAVTEHQHWLRQQRFDAYQELMTAAEPLTNRGHTVSWEAGRLGTEKVENAIRRVNLLGPQEVREAAVRLHHPMNQAMAASWSWQDVTDPCPPRPGQPVDVAGRPDLHWHPVLEQFRQMFDAFAEQAGETLDRPPG